MSKVIVTFEDQPGGGVDIRCRFTPALKMKNGQPQPTPAQKVGADFLARIKGDPQAKKAKS